MSDWMSRAREIFDAAGWVGWPLLGLSVAAVAMCIERAVFFVQLRGQLRSGTVARVVSALRSGAPDRRSAMPPGLAGEFVRAMVDASGGHGVGDSAVLAAGERCRARLERFLPALSTVITAAPMLGILGTVTGIIDSFGLLGSAEAVRDTTAMAAGISEALYTTAFGLVIALVALFPYNIFRERADRALAVLEAIGSAALEGAARDDGPDQPASASVSRVKISSGDAAP
jgi:biopolymer transport protein ExbB